MAHWGSSFAGAAHQLRLLTPEGKEQVLSLAGRVDLKIGSARECGLVLEGPGIAAQHCRIEDRKGRLILFDRGSAAGTLINDVTCREPTPLREGDRITIGLYLLEVLPGRAHLGEDAIAEHLHFTSPGWSSGEATQQMNFIALLTQDAAAWQARRSPARLLLRGARLGRAVDLQHRLPNLQHLRPWLEASAARRRRDQALRSLFSGLLPGLLVGIWLAWPAFFTPPPADPPQPPSDPEPSPLPRPKPQPRPCSVFELEPHPFESLDDVAADFGVPVDYLARENGLSPHESPPEGRPLRVCHTKPPLQREFIGALARDGDTWRSLAHTYGLPEDRLRRFNPEIDRELRVDDWIQLRVDPKILPAPRVLPEILVPTGAAAIGKPGDGELWRGIQLRSNDLYQVRCPRHAFGATAAIEALNQAIRHLRETDGYRGAIIIGDLSRETGGPFADHLSHQSGRDMDIWLPIKGGTYRQSDDCQHCGTRWCQVDTTGEDVDWDATYRLLGALHSTGQVKQIFLDLPPARRREALRGPARDAVKLVTHLANHTHHLHVRFKCSDADKATGCRDGRALSRRPSRPDPGAGPR